MNEEIEYAEMLEIPVSTVNVVRKKRAKKRKQEAPESTVQTTQTAAQTTPDLKASVIAQINDKLSDEQTDTVSADARLFAESANSGGSLHFDDIPERIDTVRLYAADERPFSIDDLSPQDYRFSDDKTENDGGRYALNVANRRESRTERRIRLALNAEFALACALCGAIFLTNVFMPGSAINTFFRTLHTPEQTDARPYTDFVLSGVVSEYTDVEFTLSDSGVLTFTQECCVYPAAAGTVREVIRANDGTYTVKIAHSDTFTGVIDGLNYVYYAEGDSVKANVPVGFSEGETQVQVTMYSEGELLNCFQITEENCLAWVEQN